MTDKKFVVESGEERWDYNNDVPTRGIIDYWVTLGGIVIRKFAYKYDAENYAKKLNDALSIIK